MFKSWQELRDEEEEDHYYSDGTLKSKYTEGNFVPTRWDDIFTDGQASKRYYEANKNNYWELSDLVYAIVILGGFFLVVMLFGWYCSL